MDTITFYIDEEEAERAENILHREVIASDELSSVTVDSPVAVIRVTGGELPNQPGIISEIVNPLRGPDPPQRHHHQRDQRRPLRRLGRP